MTGNDLYIGLDIGGTNLRCALVSEDGRIHGRSRTTSDIDHGRQSFCVRLLSCIDEMRALAEILGSRVAAIGLGVPGLVATDGTIRSSVNMQVLNGFNITGFIETETGLPTACSNDANVIALGELSCGAGRGLRSFAVITIGTGLGSGLILDGRLWTGAGGYAAEFGHVTVEPEGLPCRCGNRGCLEQYVSAGAVVRHALEAGLPEAPSDRHHAAGIAILAREGNEAALQAFDRTGYWLGIALASLANTLNLEAVIIGGGVAASADLFLPSLTREIDRRAFPLISSQLCILEGALGDDAGLLGGAALARTRLAPDRGP